jgi:NAD(P)-dependent dehydrogenase (short-subunit alcohol dehydrogenase family)
MADKVCIVTGAASGIGRAIARQMLERANRRTPWPRLGHPDDIARAVLFLCSDLSTFTTGTTLMVDGGWMAA